MRSLLSLLIVGFITWYDCQNGMGVVDNAYSFTFSTIAGEVKCLQSGQQVNYLLNENGIVVFVQPLT